MFGVIDQTIHTYTQLQGTLTPQDNQTVSEINLQASSDNFAIDTTDQSAGILTGSGNDYINIGTSGGLCFIDAGAGMNTIIGGTGTTIFSASASAQPTFDMIQNFHVGDCLVLNATAPDGFALSWWSVPGLGTMVHAQASGAAPIDIMMYGLASPDQLNHNIGHGGTSLTLTMHT